MPVFSAANDRGLLKSSSVFRINVLETSIPYSAVIGSRPTQALILQYNKPHSRKTKLRTPSTDQSSRRLKLRKKCKRTANCFIGRPPGTGSTFSRGPCVFSNYTKRLDEGHLG
ncbi:hypothetical protein TNCV_3781041 [Trichonephila clavipes]|nr:hypothetical protein TNCV_3781041 [Trichonephila clavipes]